MECLQIYSNRLRRLPSSLGKLQKLHTLWMTVEPDSEFGLSQIPLSPNLSSLWIRTYLIIQTSKKKPANRRNRNSRTSARTKTSTWNGGISIQASECDDLIIFIYVIHIPNNWCLNILWTSNYHFIIVVKVSNNKANLKHSTNFHNVGPFIQIVYYICHS